MYRLNAMFGQSERLEMNTALDLIKRDFEGRYVATAFLPLKVARDMHRMWINSNGKNRYAKLFEQFTTKRPAYRIYIPIAKHLRINTQFSPVEIDLINAFHRNGSRYDLLDYYEGKVLDTKNGQVKNITKALNELNAEGLKAAVAGATRQQIMDKVRSAFYTVAGDGKGQKTARYTVYDAENRSEAAGKIPDNAEVIWDRKTNKPRKIDRGWTELDQLINAYASDPTRENAAASNAELALVISRHPYDIASMSTGRPWTSCTNLGLSDKYDAPHKGRGSNSHTVPAAIRYGTLVAYAIRADDGNIKHPICRTNIMPFVNTQDKDDIVLDVSSNTGYGTWPPRFEYVLRRWLNAVNHGNKGGTYRLITHDVKGTKPYADRGEDRNMPSVSQDRDLEKWITKLGLKNYKIRDDKRVDVNGDVKIESAHVDRRFMLLPIKFGEVTGNFIASGCGIANLAGMPEKVGKNFDISQNQITSLEDGPKHVGGDYITRRISSLTTVIGWPEYIGGDAIFTGCGISTLRGIPKTGTIVRGSMMMDRCKLRRIDGFPERVDCVPTENTKDPQYSDEDQMGKVDFGNNEILTTVGLPRIINGDLRLANNNKLEDLIGFPEEVKGHVTMSHCPLRDLSVIENVTIGGTFQFNNGNLRDADVAKFKPKSIGGGCQFSEHYLTKKCPEPANTAKVFRRTDKKLWTPEDLKVMHALALGVQGDEFVQKTAK
jgi:hypothetical protein